MRLGEPRHDSILRRWEKLLHQAFFVGLEGVELLGLGGDEIVEGGEAVGDALLLVHGRNRDLHLFQVTWTEVLDTTTYCGGLRLPREVWASQEDL